MSDIANSQWAQESRGDVRVKYVSDETRDSFDFIRRTVKVQVYARVAGVSYDVFGEFDTLETARECAAVCAVARVLSYLAS